MKQIKNQSILNEELLQKYSLNLTLQQLEDAQDNKVVNGCLILKKEEYEGLKFQNRRNFSAVLALKLRKVPADMFYRAKNLRTVVMLEAEEISNGNLISLKRKGNSQAEEVSENFQNGFANYEYQHVGAFVGTQVENCFFPKLRRVGDYAFKECPVKTVDEQSFPSLVEVGKYGFANCSIEQLSLPSVQTVGKYGFIGAKISKVELPALKTVGKGGF